MDISFEGPLFSPLTTSCFNTLHDQMESVHKALLLHSEIQWLSRGKALVRLYKLQTELDTFCMQIIIT